MSDETGPISDADFTAYVDGRLDPDRHREVELALRANPSLLATAAADRAAIARLRRLLDPIAALPLPARLGVAAIRRRRRRALRDRVAMAACGLALLGTGAVGGWQARDLMRSGKSGGERSVLASAAADAISAHRVFVVEAAHPVEVGAAQEAHLQQWLSRRVGQRLVIPDLATLGYLLMGGRVLPAASGEAAAQFMYEATNGQRLTVYVRASPGGDTRFRFEHADGLAAFSWIDDGLGFAIVGPVERAELLGIAGAVYRQVDPQHRAAPSPL
jgi:anti-sigma factor RsiW